MSQIHQHRFANGLTLLVEPIVGVKSAAMSLLLPSGAATEPDDQLGVTQVLGEMLFRGAGDLDSRQHSDALDRLGVHRSYDVQTHHLRLGATMLGDRLDRALPLLTDMVRRPHLADTAFEPAVALALQGLQALEDEPQQKVMVEL
ncbi:MAG: insulinase family protein, partial [Phycisphaeraceae bacterium]